MMTTHLTNLIRKLIPATNHTSITDVYPCLIGQAERNAERMAKIKEEMGTLYILHPSHMKRKLKKARPV